MVELQPDPNALDRGERQWRAVITLAWPAALISAPLLLKYGGFPLCMFRQTTGQPCPLCGGTRACAALVDGNFLAAWQLSPSLMPVLALAFAHSIQLGYEALSGRRVAPRWRIGTRLWTAAGVSMLILWAARLSGWL